MWPMLVDALVVPLQQPSFCIGLPKNTLGRIWTLLAQHGKVAPPKALQVDPSDCCCITCFRKLQRQPKVHPRLPVNQPSNGQRLRPASHL